MFPAGERIAAVRVSIENHRIQARDRAVSPKTVKDLDCRLLSADEQEESVWFARSCARAIPTSFTFPAGRILPNRKLFFDPEFESIPNGWARIRPTLEPCGKKVDGSFCARCSDASIGFSVPESAAGNIFRYLGVPEQKIQRGLYGIDCNSLTPLFEKRRQLPGGWPSRFCSWVDTFIKGISTLLEGYTKISCFGAQPWSLGCCGSGHWKRFWRDVPGVQNHGFKQPHELHGGPRGSSGAFCSASSFDPWSLVISEAAASGLPILCSNSCGASAELVRPYSNGLTFPSGDADALADSMRWDAHPLRRARSNGPRSQALAADYSAEMFARRWAEARGSAYRTNRSPNAPQVHGALGASKIIENSIRTARDQRGPSTRQHCSG